VKFVDEIAEMIAEMLAKMIIENSSKYWIISSWSSFSSMFSYSKMYWWRRLLFLN
jgi:N12 class adenine-specific DNA methylase